MRSVAIFFGTILGLSVACATVPQPAPPIDAPVSAVYVKQCEKLIALVLIAKDGSLHPVELQGLTPEVVFKALLKLPEGRVLGAVVPCREMAGAI